MVKVEIDLADSEQFLLSLKKALEPDNINFPKGVKMEIKYENGILKIVSESDKESILPMLNALDEVLELTKTVKRGVSDC